jgi:hypothetical protein
MVTKQNSHGALKVDEVEAICAHDFIEIAGELLTFLRGAEPVMDIDQGTGTLRAPSIVVGDLVRA